MRSMAWKKVSFMTLGLALTAGAALAARPSDPVALLVKFQGDVHVQRTGIQDPLAGQVGLQLMAGDQVVVGERSEAVVLYRTGKLVKTAAPVTIEDVAENASSSLFTNTVRTLGQVATTDARTQPNRQGMIRPISGAPVPIAPRNGIKKEGIRVQVKVMDVRPTFTWFSVPHVESYMIQLQRQGPDSPAFVRYSVGSDTTWTLPRSEPPLVPGASYTWSVGGPGTGRPADAQSFTVASAEDIDRVQRTLNGLIDAGIDPASDGLFLAALAYRDAGFYYEAGRAITRIEEQGLGTGRSFFMLKGEVLDALGDSTASEKAFRMAEEAPDA